MVLADALARSLLGQQKSTRRWEAPEVSNFYIFLKSFCKIIRPFDFFCRFGNQPPWRTTAWASCAASELGLRRASGREGTLTGQEGGSADA
jgi:hypothetical protein